LFVPPTTYPLEGVLHAAVVRSFGTPPRYETFDTPQPSGDHDAAVRVLAAGLHPRVRSQADNSHYTSTGDLPLIPGIDGVGRLPGGQLAYFVLPDTTIGSMAEQTVIDSRRSVELPEDADPVLIAAAMNPAMSSWIALRRRISFRPGQKVMILGATGNAGQLAVQIARHLGASQVIAAGRDPQRLERLPALGADITVSLAGERGPAAARLGEAAADADVVIDYLWGQPAADAIMALLTRRPDRGVPLTWIQIGAVAGSSAPLESAALRSANLAVIGSGQGSVAAADILAELPALAREITAGTFTVNARAVPLSQVQRIWSALADPGERIVLTPAS
jgi:NADPH:quinone reductase-like Zn-dependent oxidoreductase